MSAPPLTREALTELARLAKIPLPDCGDNSCLFGGRGKGGMRTNGGCRCIDNNRATIRLFAAQFAQYAPALLTAAERDLAAAEYHQPATVQPTTEGEGATVWLYESIQLETFEGAHTGEAFRIRDRINAEAAIWQRQQAYNDKVRAAIADGQKKRTPAPDAHATDAAREEE